MTENSFYEKNTDKAVIALGFFDAVHKGHKKVISEAKRLADKLNAKSMVFTFNENPALYFGKDSKLVCTYDERKERIESLGIDSVLCAPCNKTFFDTDYEDFLKHLKDELSIIGIACGKDYTFGKFGRGNAQILRDFCKKSGIELVVVDEVSLLGEKVSSTKIRGLLESGSINEANNLLEYRYSIEGTVVKGRGDGKKELFPTVNINFPNEKVIPKAGVYATKVVVSNQTYSGVTNIGAHPTFGDFSENIETYIIDFDGELYGEVLRVEFVERLRDVIKFDSVDLLKKQISSDISKARLL